MVNIMYKHISITIIGFEWKKKRACVSRNNWWKYSVREEMQDEKGKKRD